MLSKWQSNIPNIGKAFPVGEGGGESALQADMMTECSCFCMLILLSAAPAALNLSDSKLFVDLRLHLHI